MSKLDLKQTLIKGEIKRPNKFVKWCFNIWCKIVCRRNHVQYRYDFNPKTIKKEQVILLSTHSARNEFFYTMNGFRRKDMYIICGLQNFLKNKSNYVAMRAMGVIPKMLFQPDFGCTRKMLSALKRGGNLALFPEGIQSVSGSTHPINPATARFIQKAGVNVVLSTTQGAYLTSNRFSNDEKSGKVFVRYQLLFTAEQLKTMTEQQVYETMLKHFRYDDFVANKTNRVKYVGKKPNVDGLDNILYVCPECNQKHTLKVTGTNLVCENCQHTVTLNDYYDLVVVKGQKHFEDIDKWFKWQRRLMHNDVRKDGFEMSATGRILVKRVDKWKKPPHNRIELCRGKVVLNKNGLSVGEGENAMFFGLDNLYSLTMVTGKHVEFYYKDEYYHLELDVEKTHLIEWMLASEELHNAQDEKWNAVSNDVYGYDQQGEN